MGGMEKGIRGNAGPAERMIGYLKNEEIDRSKWDACLAEIPGVKPYAWSWYLDIMAPGWNALIDDDYNSLFPLPCFRKFGSSCSNWGFFQLMATVTKGPQNIFPLCLSSTGSLT